MKQRSGVKRSARIAVRLSPEDHKRIEEGAKRQDYASPSAFIRAAIRNELNGRAELTGTEERIAAGFDRMWREISRIGKSQQAIFALVDTFVKTVLTCMPEPPSDAKPQAIARARDRYERLIRTAGQSMSSDARTTMRDLEDHGTK
jgi:Arc/MetJ-type ribon-helix-helix transcriptional regulator